MPRRRLINGALEGFLGTMVSRYSEWHGYWLLGFLAVDRRSLEIDLRRGTDYDLHEGCFAELALRKFDEQLSKWRIPVAWVVDARMDVIWSEEVASGFVATRHGGVNRDGRVGTFTVSVKTDLGRTLARAKQVFVAPHDPHLELSSARAA
jgi:hypothetical protein